MPINSVVRLSDEELDYIRINAGKLKDKDIAEWIGCSVELVFYYRKKWGIKPYCVVWDDESINLLTTMWNRGDDAHDIANFFGTSSVNIYTRITLLRKRGTPFYRTPAKRGRKPTNNSIEICLK